MVSEEISAIKKKSSTLHRDHRKDSIRESQESDPTYPRFNNMKELSHLKDFSLGKECHWGTLLINGSLRKCFSRFPFTLLRHTQAEHSEAAAAVVQVSLVAARDGGRPWHCSHYASFAGMQNPRVVSLCRLPHRLQRKA
jgi:hypothetical protein